MDGDGHIRLIDFGSSKSKLLSFSNIVKAILNSHREWKKNKRILWNSELHCSGDSFRHFYYFLKV